MAPSSWIPDVIRVIIGHRHGGFEYPQWTIEAFLPVAAVFRMSVAPYDAINWSVFAELWTPESWRSEPIQGLDWELLVEPTMPPGSLYLSLRSDLIA